MHLPYQTQGNNVRKRQNTPSIYSSRKAILTTKHDKLAAVALPMAAGLGLETIQSNNIDTDLLGTFSGEVERSGTPLETAIKKAELGISDSGIPLGLASEGSFGPHPACFFLPGHQEFIVFIDKELGITVAEQVLSNKTNFDQTTVKYAAEAEDFLARVYFPSHGLIVRPNIEKTSFIQKLKNATATKASSGDIVKGITDYKRLGEAIELCRKKSEDGLARIETDMRAHMNPLRRKVIRKVAIKLARRLKRICMYCGTPGWGISGSSGNLPCELCGFLSSFAANEIHSCAKCSYSEILPRQDGMKFIEPRNCEQCNP